MGNRALICMESDLHVGIYVHWNGGYDSIYAFVEYCKLKRYELDSDYGLARMTQVIANYFGGNLSIGIKSTTAFSDPGDNGVYIIDKNGAIAHYMQGMYVPENKETHEYFIHDDLKNNEVLLDFLLSIDAAQPTEEQLGEEFLEADIIPVADIQKGMNIFVYDRCYGKWGKHKVVGYGEDKIINGQHVLDIPYTDEYKSSNINAYLLETEYRVARA